MANKKKHSAEEVVKILRDIEIEQAKGASQDDACRKVGITLQTFYRWRKEYGGLQIDHDPNPVSVPVTLRLVVAQLLDQLE